MIRTPLLAGTALLASAASARAQDVAFDGRYIADTMVVAAGEGKARAYLLHAAEAGVTADLGDVAFGAQLLATAGGNPNDAAGTLQGIDNYEVPRHGAKLYQAWAEHRVANGRASLRVGLFDLNGEFYQNDSAGLLIAPAFGIGSELAATGPNGPSIFPSTALTARVSAQIGGSGYVRAAVVNAKSGVLGDPHGIDFGFADGALLIAEGGTTRGGELAIGLWRYTRRQADIHAGIAAPRIAQGAYLLVDQQVAPDTHVFLRAGLSDGSTSPFRGGFQAGVLTRPFAARPQGQLSFGIQAGLLGDGFRDTLVARGVGTTRTEAGIELTYADQVAPFLTLQPDLHYVRRAYPAGGSRGVFAFGLRLTAALAR